MKEALHAMFNWVERLYNCCSSVTHLFVDNPVQVGRTEQRLREL